MAFIGQAIQGNVGTISWAEYKAWLDGYLFSHIGELSDYQLSNIKDKINTVRTINYEQNTPTAYTAKAYQGEAL